MASHHEPVTLAGHLSGMSREADCNVDAVKVSVRGTNLFKYARVMIFDEPSDLPEGRYRLSFEGRTIPVQKHGLAWVSIGP